MEISSTLLDLIPKAGAFSGLLNLDPIIRGLQIALGITAALLVYLVFWSTRDALRRTNSLLYQLACIAIVASLPMFGFFFYLMIRPTQTLREREMEKSINEILSILQERQVKIKKVKDRAKLVASKSEKITVARNSEQKEANKRIVSKIPTTA